MRKRTLLTGMLATMLVFAMTGCSGNSAEGTTAQALESTDTTAQESNEASSAKSEAEEDSLAATESANTETIQEENEGEEEETMEHQILIAYFSWSGNTGTLADMIAEETGGELFEIEPAEAYTDDYDAVVALAQEEQAADVRPALAADVENWEDYDIVFLGYPNWWSDVPMVLNTFMEGHDFTGKSVIPFCTSGGGGFGRSIESVEAGTEGAEVLEGFEVNGSSVDSAAGDIAAWINSLGLGV